MPTRVALENDSVKLAFDATTNCVPCELVDKQGNGQNLIVNNFCLHCQYVEGGAIRSVNEGYPGGRIANGRHRVEKQAGAATVEFRGETPHFRLTRRVTVPATGPVVKFVYELEATTSDIFGFSLPYAPLWPKLNKRATFAELIGANGEKAGRVIVEDVQSPTLHTGSPYDRAECYFNDQSGEGLVFAHLAEECVAGISRCTLALTSKGEKLGDVGVRLEVWNFTLAPTPHICAFATDYVYYYDHEVELNNEVEAKAQVLKSSGTLGWFRWSLVNRVHVVLSLPKANSCHRPAPRGPRLRNALREDVHASKITGTNMARIIVIGCFLLRRAVRAGTSGG